MPIEFAVSPDGEEVELTLVGRITSEEYVTFFREVLSHSTAPLRVRTTLMDVTNGDVSGLSNAAVREVAEMTAEEARRNPGRRAMAAIVHDPLTFGLARQWDLLSNDPQNRLEFFDSREPARLWLRQHRAQLQGSGDTPPKGA